MNTKLQFGNNNAKKVCESCGKTVVNIATHIKCVQKNRKTIEKSNEMSNKFSVETHIESNEISEEDETKRKRTMNPTISFAIGQQVEYFDFSQRKMLDAHVIERNYNGSYRIQNEKKTFVIHSKYLISKKKIKIKLFQFFSFNK